jgi:phenylalanyl-tRNA synthetase beta chain
MPKIEVHEKLFNSLLNKQYSDEQLEEIFPVAKAELDDHDTKEKLYKIELNDTNRPDLWSASGVARALNTYETKKIPPYNFFSTPLSTKDSQGRTLIIDESVAEVRPYSIGFCATGVVVDDKILENLIQTQEKLCNNFGRKRKSIAMGVYRSDLISFPVHYKGVDPDTTSFVPLHMDEKLTLREILTKHPKGVEYGHIVQDSPLFPLLTDANGDVLSFPPVINSDRIGAVKEGDEHLFFEFSGPGLEDLLLAASIVACDCADLGYTILPVTCKIPHKEDITVPFYFQEKATCEVSYLHKTLGDALTNKEITDALLRMGVNSTITKGVIEIDPPFYRNDFLHPVDIVEDVMIGHGLASFSPELPKDSTVGRLTENEMFARKVKDICIGMGFQEMMYNYLGSRKEYIDNMHVSGDDYIQIANPMSENYEYVRPSIIPSLLESESVSAHAVYPHNIFEVGKVAFLDDDDNSGTVTKNYLGFLGASTEMGFNQLNSYISTLMYFLNREYVMEELVDPRFIEGRCGILTVEGKKVGIFGEIHPSVLDSWNIAMPTIACELDLDALL